MSNNTNLTKEQLTAMGLVEAFEGSGQYVKAETVREVDYFNGHGKMSNDKANLKRDRPLKIQPNPNIPPATRKRAEKAVKEVKQNKIRNATKIEVGGVKFDSRLEAYLYSQLIAHNILFEFQKAFELQPAFRYNGKAIRSINIIVDFYLLGYNTIIDSKGWQLADNKIKWKMLKNFLAKCKTNEEIYLPKNRKEVDVLILKLRAK